MSGAVQCRGPSPAPAPLTVRRAEQRAYLAALHAPDYTSRLVNSLSASELRGLPTTRHRVKGKQTSDRHLVKNRCPTLELIRRLAHRQERDRHRLYFAEGLRALHRAVESRSEIVAVVYAPRSLTHRHALDLIDRLGRLGIPTIPVSIETFATVSR